MKSDTENNSAAQENKAALIADVKAIIQQARSQVYSVVNSAMVQAYWLIGRRIVEEEQGGKERAEYGKRIVETVAKS